MNIKDKYIKNYIENKIISCETKEEVERVTEEIITYIMLAKGRKLNELERKEFFF